MSSCFFFVFLLNLLDMMNRLYVDSVGSDQPWTVLYRSADRVAPGSDCRDVQADLELHCPHMAFYPMVKARVDNQLFD